MSSIHVARIGPQRLHHNSLITRLSLSVRLCNISQLNIVFRIEASVTDHDLSVYAVGKGQVTEELGKKIVCLNIVLVLHFALKAVHFVQLLGLVVSSAHEKVLREADFPSKHEHDNLNGEGTSVNEVTVEEIGVLFAWVSVDLKDVHKIVILTVNVTTDCDLFEFVD